MIKEDLKLSKGDNSIVFTELHEQLIKEAAKRLMAVLNGGEFENKVKNYSWKKKRGPIQYRFSHTQISREKVFEQIISGDDIYSTNDSTNDRQLGDNDVDIHIIPYKTSINIVGRTYKNNPKTWINLNYINNKLKYYDFDIVANLIAKNMIHEYCHNLGFKHKGNKPKKHNNKHSVPYAVGKIVFDLLMPNNFILEDNLQYNCIQKNHFH